LTYNTIIIDQKNNNTRVDLRANQNLIVNLPANPSTGYRWEIVKYDEDLLTLNSRDYKQREAAPGLVGVGGTESFSFKALKPGQTRLVMRYARAHPNPEDTAEDFTLEIGIN
jgi:inhibitor of cysteine peptidase